MSEVSLLFFRPRRQSMRVKYGLPSTFFSSGPRFCKVFKFIFKYIFSFRKEKIAINVHLAAPIRSYISYKMSLSDTLSKCRYLKEMKERFWILRN